MKKKEFEKAMEPLSVRLAEMAYWAKATGQRIVILFEGRDTAGKGGAINTIADVLNPRQCKVVALSKPSEAEQGQWYFQRYVEHLPTKGEIALFDRSWYNRAGVERVMGFATPEQVDTFLEQTPVFEKMLTDDGILLFKYWLCCDQDEQEQRFAERFDDPLKRYKLSPMDAEARTRYDEYTKAREHMLKATHTKHAPWTLVDFNSQKQGRLTLVADLLDRLPEMKIPKPDFELPPLNGEPSKESFSVLKPLPDYEG
ncbi:polyphosphate kinase 2 [Luteimonas sp. FXH3W]|uniref:ADP/GDP-polyphosphate phosphotransferase n=1 Tax=Aquilutibacter rugosus TaxID=3115820 RepID=A0ABU7UX83_9GAMM